MPAIDLDQPGPQLGRLEVGDPDAGDALDRGELRQQLLQRAQVAQVLAVGGGVLADQHQLGDARGGQPPASASTSAGGRETNEPRKAGMAQKAQRRSQPEASFSARRGAGGQPPAAQPVVAGDRASRPRAPRSARPG